MGSSSEKKATKKKTPFSSTVGLLLPPSKGVAAIRKEHNGRVSSRAGVVLSAAVEYVLAELLEIAAETERKARKVEGDGVLGKKVRIGLSSICSAVHSDRELNAALGDVYLASGKGLRRDKPNELGVFSK